MLFYSWINKAPPLFFIEGGSRTALKQFFPGLKGQGKKIGMVPPWVVVKIYSHRLEKDDCRA